MKSKRIICLFLSALMLLVFASCSRGDPPKPNQATLAQSRAHFSAFQKDIVQILDDNSVEYTLTVTSSDDMPGAQPDTYSLALRFDLKTPAKESLIVTMLNNGGTEHFLAVLEADRATVKECDFAMGDYPFLLAIFNLLSDTGTSKSECNRLMRSTRRGAAELYEQQGNTFYTFKFKYLYKDQEDRYLEYEIQYSDAKQPGFFTETLTFAGFASARQADSTSS